jgi:hypothetical protein
MIRQRTCAPVDILCRRDRAMVTTSVSVPPQSGQRADSGTSRVSSMCGSAPGDFDEPHDIFLGGSQNRI